MAKMERDRMRRAKTDVTRPIEAQKGRRNDEVLKEGRDEERERGGGGIPHQLISVVEEPHRIHIVILEMNIRILMMNQR